MTAPEDGADEGWRYGLSHTLTGHERSVSSAKFSPDGKLIATSSADKTVRLWDPESGKELRVLRGHTQGVSDVCWSHNGKFLASASDDKTLILWDVETGEELRKLEGHTNYVFCCAFHPEDNQLVSGSFDETVRLWETRSGKCLRELPAHSDPVTAVDYSMDGMLIVSASFDGLCRIWDANTGQCFSTLIPPGNPPVSFVRFTPNCRFLLVATLDNKLSLWGIKDMKLKKCFQDHVNKKFCLLAAFQQPSSKTKNKPWLVCGSEDNGIFIWDLNSKEVVQKLEGRESSEAGGTGHSSAVVCVDVHSDSGLMVSGSLEKDCSIKIWSLQKAAP